MEFSKVNLLSVSLDIEKNHFELGKLALKNHQIWFEYNQEFLDSGLEVSPFKLPLKPGIHKAKENIFAGLFGVFKTQRLIWRSQTKNSSKHKSQ